MINGIINVYKESGYTSHDVVAKLRRILGQKKIGHTGTLDPQATGVLPVCLGSGTKLCDMLTDKSKEYEAEFLLGFTTDTQDIWGTVCKEYEVRVQEPQVIEAINNFVGGYDQTPPMYSAKKINGKKLYELAREGKEITRATTHIKIDAIEILLIDLPKITMKVSCSKGTYIRTLCYDIGEKLGCGATMTALKRVRVGEFRLEDAYTLDQIEELASENEIDQIVRPVEDVFVDYPDVSVTMAGQKLLDNGNAFYLKHVQSKKGNLLDGEQVRIYSYENRFCAIYQFEENTGRFFPVKMFFER